MSPLLGWLGVGLIVGVLPTTATAQQSADDDSAAAASPIDWYGDLRLRGEHTSNIPGRPDDLERVRSAVRAGASSPRVAPSRTDAVEPRASAICEAMVRFQISS